MKGTYVERVKKPKAKPVEDDPQAKKRKAKQQRLVTVFFFVLLFKKLGRFYRSLL